MEKWITSPLKEGVFYVVTLSFLLPPRLTLFPSCVALNFVDKMIFFKFMRYSCTKTANLRWNEVYRLISFSFFFLFFSDDTPIYSSIKSTLTNIVLSRFQISIPECYSPSWTSLWLISLHLLWSMNANNLTIISWLVEYVVMAISLY